LCSHELAKHFLGILKGSQLTAIEGINLNQTKLQPLMVQLCWTLNCWHMVCSVQQQGWPSQTGASNGQLSVCASHGRLAARHSGSIDF
jgi:hypothetical protein